MRKKKFNLNGLVLKLEEKKSLFLLVYTVVFLITFTIVFALFIWEGKSLIWKADGYEQHLKGLMYIRKYYTEFILSHKLPAYDFNIGLGANPFTTLTYYGFFDPINLVSVIVPLKYTDYLYSFLTILRLYLSGLAFIYMCRYFRNKRWYSIIGSVLYLTTSYVLISGLKHPFFLNPMIYFPLLIVGLNKILKKEKPYLFIFGISFSALSGFYFLYMMTIMLFVYANIRFFELNKNTDNKMKCYFSSVFRVVLYYALSCGLVAAVLLPQIFAFLNSNRVGKAESMYGTIFAHLQYVIALFYVRAGASYLGISSIVFFTILLVFLKYRKERIGIVFLMILSIVGIGVPGIAKLMNGFSYPSNRWMFGTALLLAYLFVKTLPELIESKERKWIFPLIIGVNIVYLITMVFSKEWYIAGNIIILDVMYVVIYKLPAYFERKNRKLSYTTFTVLLLLIIMGNVVITSFSTYADFRTVSSYMKHDNYKKYMESQEVSFKNSRQKEKADGIHEFYRVDGSDFKVNLGMIAGIPNSGLYFSIMNPYIAEFFEEFHIADHHNKVYVLGMDGRAVAGNLISNKFFVASDKETGEVPYGYKYKEKVGKYKIYQNQNFLPFGYTYDSYVTYDEAEEYFSLDKETNMLDYVYLEEEIPQIRKGKMKKYVKEIDYTIETGNDVVYKEKEYIDFASSKKEKKSDKNKERYFKLLFEEEKNKEIYLYLKGILLDNRYRSVRVNLTSDKVKKGDYLISKRSELYFNRNDYLFHLGNANRKKKSCSFYLNKTTKFPISDIKVLSVSLEDYEEKIKRLKKDCLQNVEFGVNRVTGEISLTEPKILAMSIPYEKGWTAYVDGKKAEILRGNYMFSCLALDKGKHKIEMRYRPYGMETAVMITILSVIGLGCVIVYDRRKKIPVS